MAYAVENALYQWREGERRLAGAPEPARADLDARRRRAWSRSCAAGSARRFVLDELADLYAAGTDWATELAWRHARRHRRRERGGRRLRPLRCARPRTTPAAARARSTRSP